MNTPDQRSDSCLPGDQKFSRNDTMNRSIIMEMKPDITRYPFNLSVIRTTHTFDDEMLNYSNGSILWRNFLNFIFNEYEQLIFFFKNHYNYVK